jgi:hypothetical protein
MRFTDEDSLLTRRRILQGAVTLAASAIVSGGFESYARRNHSGSNVLQPVPSGTLQNVSILVSDEAAGNISAGFAGLSYEKSMLCSTKRFFSPANEDLIRLFQRLGPSVLRIGAATVDQSVWTAKGDGQTKGQIAPSDVAALAAFVKAAGWKCLYGVNLAGATTPALAAEEVAYAAEKFGSSLLGIELGNEPDLHNNIASYNSGDWTLPEFMAKWTLYRKAILETTPSANLTGPATGGGSQRKVESWTVPFGRSVTKDQITLLTQHYYVGDGRSPLSTPELLIAPNTPKPLLALLKSLQVGAASIGLPYRMAECNTFYYSAGNLAPETYASAFWVIDFLFTCAMHGASGVDIHSGSYSGREYVYTPIVDAEGLVSGLRPEYYGMLLFTLAGLGTLHPTTVVANSLNVTAYAVEDEAGKTSIVVLNKELTQNLHLTIQLTQAVHKATLLVMTQHTSGINVSDLKATSGVTIQSATVGINGSFHPAEPYAVKASGSQVTCYVPALSAVVIHTA